MSDLLFGTDVRPSAEMAVALINTAPIRGEHEGLTSVDDVVALGAEARIYYRPEGSQAELHALRTLRERLDAIVNEESAAGRFDMLNELFLSASAIPQIVTHAEDPTPHFHYTLEDASYVDHIKAICAYAFSRLIIMDEWARLRTCSREACNRLFFDVSRNGGRLYCNSRTCGNLVHAKRYRERKRED